MTTSREFALLQALKDVHPYGIPKKALFADINIRLAKNMVVTVGDFNELLHTAETKGRIKTITGEDDVLVMITDQGALRLADFR